MENWWSTIEEREGNQGWALFVECRAAKPWREEKVIRVHLVSALVSTSTLRSTHLPSPTHLCTFVHSSCEVQFWGWEHNYNRRIATTLTKSLKKNIFPNWNKTREERLLPPPVYNHIFVLSFGEERNFANGWRKIHATLTIWSECSSRKPIFLSIVWDGLAVSFP